jgi:protein-tyrosine-phosphatase
VGFKDIAMKKRILFLCTHNSARSQMAEGLLRALGGGHFEAFSAGTEATQVQPLAIKAMAEIGIDIAKQQSKTLERYLNDTTWKVSRDRVNKRWPLRWQQQLQNVFTFAATCQ